MSGLSLTSFDKKPITRNVLDGEYLKCLPPKGKAPPSQWLVLFLPHIREDHKGLGFLACKPREPIFLLMNQLFEPAFTITAEAVTLKTKNNPN